MTMLSLLDTNSAPWDEHLCPGYPNTDVDNCSINPFAAGCILDQDADQFYRKNSYQVRSRSISLSKFICIYTSRQYEGLKQYLFQSASNLHSISPLTTTLSPPESPSPSPPSTISSSPNYSKCDLDFEGCIAPFDLQRSFSSSPLSPIDYSFGWNVQFPSLGLEPLFLADPTDISSLLPNTRRPTFPISSPALEICLETLVIPKVDSERLSSLSPLTSIISLPTTEFIDNGSPTRNSERTNQILSINDSSLSPSSTPFLSPSPLPLSSDSTLLRKSTRLASKAGENSLYSPLTECQSAAIPTMNSCLKRSFEESTLADDSDDTPEHDDDYTDGLDEGIYEPIAHRRSKKPKKQQKKPKLRKRCPNCPETFTRSADRARHLAAIHGINSKSKEEDQCRGCSKSLSRRDSRQRHERKCVDFIRTIHQTR